MSLRDAINLLVAEVVKTEGTDERGAIRDVLTEAMHWCKARGIDFSDRLLAAAEVFGEEEEINQPEVGYCSECERTHGLGRCPPPDRDPDMP